MINKRKIIIPEDFLKLEKFKARFLSKVQKTHNCWEWTASKDSRGYGKFVIDDKPFLAHRVSFTIFVGIIPNDLTIDHLCRNRACVNPEHLEAVTNRENTLRGNNTAAQNARKTHCIRGHKFTSENIYVRPNNNRGCKTCKKLRASIEKQVLSSKEGINQQ